MSLLKYPTSFAEYLQLLATFDWHYAQSDDYKVWVRGTETVDHLQKLGDVHPLWKQAYDTWYAYIYRGMKAAERDQKLSELKVEALITA